MEMNEREILLSGTLIVTSHSGQGTMVEVVSQLKERKIPLKTALGAKNANLRQGLQCLTPREIEVLTLVAEGYTSQEIAERLILSIKTVQAHRANITEKLGLHDIAHLVRFALRHRLVELEA